MDQLLSIGKLAKGREAYYLAKVAQGIKDHISGEDEAQDRRVGARAPACPVSKATPRPRH